MHTLLKKHRGGLSLPSTGSGSGDQAHAATVRRLRLALSQPKGCRSRPRIGVLFISAVKPLLALRFSGAVSRK